MFGGYHFGSDWQTLGPDELSKGDDHSNQIARKVIKYAIAGAGSNDQASRFLQLVNENLISSVKLEDIDGFEILEVIQPDDATTEFYHEAAPDLIPVGKIRAKSYRDPANPEVDMSAEERADWERGNAPAYEFEIFLEPELLSYCYPGLKVIAGIWELNCGVYYFDEIMSTLPSFYTTIANDLMLHWKWPKELTKEDAKQQDSLEKSAEETVELYMNSKDTYNSSGTPAIAGISCDNPEKCKELTGVETLTQEDPPEMGEPHKHIKESDKEDNSSH